VANIKMAVFWVAAPCSLVGVYRRLITLMMEAASISETSVNCYQITRRNNSEDSHINTSVVSNGISRSLFPSVCGVDKIFREGMSTI
jgi:hypothetical protein